MPVTKICESCGKTVTRPPSHMKGNVYCSKECSQRKKYSDVPKEKTCKLCGKAFSKSKKQTWDYWKIQKFCSHGCYSESLKGKKNPRAAEVLKNLWANNAEFYAKMMNRPPHSAETRHKIGKAFRGKRLTEEHRQKISDAVKGEKHPLYGKKMDPDSIRRMAEKRRGIPLSNEHKRKISELFTGRRLSAETKAKLSRITKDKWENDPDYVHRLLEGLSGKKRTSIEIKIASILSELSVEFEEQKVISRCIVDFYIPKGNKIIEADGDYWHSSPEKKAKDKRRDFFLMDMAYHILRLSETEINDNPLPKIIEFLEC
jgi:very-short-patch-repair endonuclease